MRLCFLVLFPVCLAPLAAQWSETVSIDLKNGHLHGILYIADTSATTPVVFIHAGSGPTDRDGNQMEVGSSCLLLLAEALAEYNISSLRVDKRGIGLSASPHFDESHTTIDSMIGDARRWLDFLQEDPRFDGIYALGHSEGALITAVAAQAQTLDGFINLAGPGRPFAQVLRDQIYRQSPFLKPQVEPIFLALEEGERVDSVPPYLMSLFRPSVQPYLISWFGYDPAEELAKVDCPVIIINGRHDIQVDTAEAMILHRARPDAEFALIDSMSHILKVAPPERFANIATYNQEDLPIIPELVSILVSFIRDE